MSGNNISNYSTTLVEDPIQINLMTSQSAASTITYNTPCGKFLHLAVFLHWSLMISNDSIHFF